STVNVDGEDVRVIQLTNFNLMEHIENLRRQASESEEKPCSCFPITSGGTPINTLPNELLSYIFTLGSEAEENGDDDDDDDCVDEDEYGGITIHIHRRLPYKVLVSH